MPMSKKPLKTLARLQTMAPTARPTITPRVTALRIAIIFVVAAAINFLWEVAQMPFYAGQGSFFDAAAHCVIPSLGDGIIVLMIYGIGWLFLRQSDWSDRPGVWGYMLMLLSGFILAMLIEWGAVYVLGRWSYAANMPLLPGLGIGVIPILQMLILPPVIFKVTARSLDVIESLSA